MPIRLKNENIALTIEEPDEGYQGSRFDWTGKILTVYYKGRPFSGFEKLDNPDPTLGRGFFNEFGIDHALGFGDAKQGEWFHKIGIGLLKKTTKLYAFNQQYEVKPCEFKVQNNDQSVQVSCISPNVLGYSYELKKTISLLTEGFQIEYSLLNAGEHSILTDEYNHNFVTISEDRINSSYRLKFEFDLDRTGFDEVVNPDDALKISAREFNFKHEPDEFFISNLSGGNMVKAGWTLENHTDNLSIQERSDFETNKINLWGNGHVICPELFKKIELLPGETDTWTRTYNFRNLAM